MDAWNKYFEVMQKIVKEVEISQKDNIKKAARFIADSTKQGGTIHLFGAGHSHLITEDVFYRAATLANVHAILEPSITGMSEITKASRLEQLKGFGEVIVDYHQVKEIDVMICISNSGNKPITIDVALACKKRNIKVIVITNVKYSRYLNANHENGFRLCDVGDVVIDNCSVIGDAAIEIDRFKMKVGSTSTIPSVFIQTSMMCQAVEYMVQEEFEPDVYYNGSLDVNDHSVALHNNKMIKKYYNNIRNL